jgi:SNF2 family DNA or RNA helicase
MEFINLKRKLDLTPQSSLISKPILDNNKRVKIGTNNNFLKLMEEKFSKIIKLEKPLKVSKSNKMEAKVCRCNENYMPANEFDVRMIAPYVLYDFQKAAVRWCIMHERGLIKNQHFNKIGYMLAMFMGLGKSLCSGTICMITREIQRSLKQPTLILTEKSLLESFQFELNKFFGSQLNVLILHRDFLKSNYDKIQTTDLSTYDVVITTYSTIETKFKQNAKHFCDFRWFRIILDESHVIRNRSTLTFKFINMLQSNTRMCMTGTPIYNGIKDLFTQLEFCGLNLPKTIKKTETVFENLKLYEMVNFIITSPVKLPPKRVHQIYFELSPVESYLHQYFLNRTKTALVNTTQKHVEIQNGLTRLMQICTAPYLITKASKLDSNKDDMTQQEPDSLPEHAELNEWLHKRESQSGLLSSKLKTFVNLVAQTQHKKTIVFANLTSSLRLAIDSLIMACPSFKSRIVFVHGKIRDTKVRGELFSKFRTDPTVTHLFMTLKVGGCGLNLVEAKQIIFLETWFNYSSHEQAESRAWRIGQTEEVNIYYILGKNTIEERIAKMIQDKKNMSDKVVKSSVKKLEALLD